MTDLGPTTYYLGMEVTRTNDSITVIQMVNIDKLLASHQMTNCNITTTSMFERLYLLPATNDFIPKDADVTAYKHFTGSAQ